MSSVVVQNGGGLKLLGTVAGNSTKSDNYFDSIGANNYEFVYISVKGVSSSGAEIRGGAFIRSDSFSVDTATGNVDIVITGNTTTTATVKHRKSSNDWLFNSLSNYATTYSIYGVAI